MVLKRYLEKYNDGGSHKEEDRKKQAFQFFVSKGYTPEQAAGIVGNLIQESQLNTKAHNKSEGSMGIAQWNPSEKAGNRLGKLKKFAKENDMQWTDFNAQLEFIDHELNTVRYLGGEQLREAQTPEEAAQIFSEKYERPHKDYAHNDKRQNNSLNIYNAYAVKPQEVGEYNEYSNQTKDYIERAETVKDNTNYNKDYKVEDTTHLLKGEPTKPVTKQQILKELEDYGKEQKEQQTANLQQAQEQLNTQEQQPKYIQQAQQYQQQTKGFDPYNYIDINNYQDGGKYTIKRGDNLSTIAKNYGTSVAEILNLNPNLKENPDKIDVGQQIKISSSNTTPIDENDPFKMVRPNYYLESKEQIHKDKSISRNDNIVLKEIPETKGRESTYVKKHSFKGNIKRLFEDTPWDTMNMPLEETIISVNPTKDNRAKEIEDAVEISTNYIDNTFEDGISTPNKKKDIIKVQTYLESKGYDLNPENKFKNDGIDGKMGEVTKKAIEDFNSKNKKTFYNSIKEGKGFLGECTEKQCSEYVQNEIYRNINPKINRAEWNETIGITGDAWDLGNSIIEKGGKQLDLFQIREGDIVGIDSGSGGRNLKEAKKVGRNYTHSGVVDKVNSDGTYYVLHNWHKRSGNKWIGQEYRTLVDPKKGHDLKGFAGKGVVEAFRPNYTGETPKKVIANKEAKVKIGGNIKVKKEAESFIEPINNPEIKEKFMNVYNLDEKEFYTVAKATLGIIGQETNFGEDIEYKSNAKYIGANLSKAANKIPKLKMIAHALDINLKDDEISRGAGSMKLKTNFSSAESSIFQIDSSNLNNPEKASLATMQKVVNDYKYFKKKGFNEEDSIYRAIMKYNGSLETVTAGKKREEWAKDKDLDYVNKVINFTEGFKVKLGDKEVRTFLTDLALNEKVWAKRKQVESQY